MKKIILLAMLICVLLSLAACENTNDYKYDHSGDTQKAEETEAKEKDVSEEKDNAFPKYDFTNHWLGKDITESMRVMGFIGPSSSYGNMARNIFHLKETDSIDFYLQENHSHIMGMKDGKLVLEGWWYNLPFTVRTLVGNDVVAPAIYTVAAPTDDSPGYQAYVWKIGDGYQSLIVSPIHQNFLDNNVYSRIDISDIKYLEYADKGSGIGNHSGTQEDGYWNSDYGYILDDAMKEFPQYKYSCNYILYDIEDDGIPEMFVKIGTCEADFEYRIFKISEDKTGARLVATIPAEQASVCGIESAGSFLLWAGHQGLESIYKYTLKGDLLGSEELFFDEVNEYHELTPLITYELDDPSGLYWVANAEESNQQALDEFTGDKQAEGSYTVTSLELSTVPISTGYPAYDEKIAEYKNAIVSIHKMYSGSRNYFDETAWDHASIDAHSIGRAVEYSGGRFMYSLYDIDENGTPELIFSLDDYQKTLIDIYALKDNVAYKLFETVESLDILSGGRLLTEGSEDSESYDYYVMYLTLQHIGSDGYSLTDAAGYYVFTPYEDVEDNGFREGYISVSADEYFKLRNGWQNESVVESINWSVFATITMIAE